MLSTFFTQHFFLYLQLSFCGYFPSCWHIVKSLSKCDLFTFRFPKGSFSFSFRFTYILLLNYFKHDKICERSTNINNSYIPCAHILYLFMFYWMHFIILSLSSSSVFILLPCWQEELFLILSKDFKSAYYHCKFPKERKKGNSVNLSMASSKNGNIA